MKSLARSFRKRQTDAENILWRSLRNRRMSGYKFRRQHRIGPFIADFAYLEKMIIIEVDGGQHSLKIELDKKRTEYFESRGFRVVRFWNNQVLHETEGVLEVIFSYIKD